MCKLLKDNTVYSKHPHRRHAYELTYLPISDLMRHPTYHLIVAFRRTSGLPLA